MEQKVRSGFVVLIGCAVAVLMVALMTLPSIDGEMISIAQARAGGVSDDLTRNQTGPAKVKVGVYYFPGWRDRTPAAPSDHPWVPIKRFPEREPMLGWYAEGDLDVMARHLDVMARNGISYVAFDWYWGSDNRVYLGHALDAYLNLTDKRGVAFSLLWVNHDDAPVSLRNFDRMVEVWVQRYFSSSSYLKVLGKPVVTVFSPAQLESRAASMKMTVAQLLDRAGDRAREAGLPGIYFVAASTSDAPGFKTYVSTSSGYSAVSAYNLHWHPGKSHPAHSYTELDQAYREHWRRYRAIGALPVVVPMSSGWDKRPWGGSDDPLLDRSLGTPEEFELHLRAGVEEVVRGGEPYLGVVCCWNEFGEGSYVEPTKALGEAVVSKIGKVLKESAGQ